MSEVQKVFDLIRLEQERQSQTIELIASENFVSDDVLKATGSCLTNKYAEGYPGKRYYGGCHVVDQIENLCRDQWKKVFNTDYHVNVQPHSGSQANFAAYAAILQPGDTILSMSLDNGAHLTHGSPVNFSGKLYDMVFYSTDDNGYIDMNDVREKALACHPKLILTGASAYPRVIDFAAFRRIADEVGAYLMVDMAHIAGLVAAGCHPSPFEAVLRHHHHHHAQDAARPARRPDFLQAGAGEKDRQRRFPRLAGRPAGARHRRQGRRRDRGQPARLP